MLQNPIVTRKYKVRDRQTGKEYTLEWDKPTEPTELDVEQKLSEAKRSTLPDVPPITGSFDYKEPSTFSKLADKAFTPLTSFAQETGKKVSDYIQDSPKVKFAAELADAVRGYPPGTTMTMPEAIGLGADSFTSPASIGTMGLGTANTILPIAAKNALRAAETPKQIKSANRLAKTAQGVYLANQGVNAGFTAKGAYDFSKDGSIEGAAQALIGAGGLGLGMKNARNIPKTRPIDSNVIPERPTINSPDVTPSTTTINPLPKTPTKYGSTELQFEDDIDRALFAIGNPKGTPRTVTPVMNWLVEQTKLTSEELTKAAPLIRKAAIEVRDNSTDKIVNIPKIFGVQKPVAREPAQEPTVEQPITKEPIAQEIKEPEKVQPLIVLKNGSKQEITLTNPSKETVEAIQAQGYTWVSMNRDKTMDFKLTGQPKVPDEVKVLNESGIVTPQEQAIPELEGTRPRNIAPAPTTEPQKLSSDKGELYLGARDPKPITDYKKAMRESMATTNIPKYTRFIDPDGIRYSALGEHANAINVALETNAIKPEKYFHHINNALKAGVVRVIPGNGGVGDAAIEIGRPLTRIQAKMIVDDYIERHADSLHVDAFFGDELTNIREQGVGRLPSVRSKSFHGPVDAGTLQRWSEVVFTNQQTASSDIGAIGDIFNKKQAKKQDPDLFDESDDVREIKVPKGKADKTDKLRSVIRQAKPMQGEQAELYARERAKRFEAASQVPLKGERGYFEMLGKLKGELPKIQFEPIRDKFTQKEIDFYNDEIRRTIPLDTDAIHAMGGLRKLFEGNVPTKSELTQLDKVFGNGFGDEIIELHGGLGAVGMNITRKSINSLKTLKTIYDLSAILNQNKGRMWSPEFYKSIPLTIKAFPSQKVYDQTMAMIKSHPKFERAKKAKLSYLDEHVRNEEMQESYVDKLPGVKASNRAMNLPGNYNRFMTFYRLSDLHDKVVYKPGELELLESKAREKGKVYNDPDDFAIARMLNITTRRGRLPKREITLADGTKRTVDYEQNADDMNLVFFSPRNQWSILQYFNPKNYTTGPKAVQWEFRKSLMAIIGFGLLSTYIKKFTFGAEVETDPTSSDFMKAQFGNTRDDPFSGLQQPFVLAMRMATGKSKSIAGNVTDLNKGGFRDRIDVIGSYLRSKESPFADIVHSALAGSDYLGEKFDLTDPMTLPKKLPPMSMEMAYEIVMDDPNLMALIPLGILGESIQTFTPNKKSSSGSNMKNIRPIRANVPQYVPAIR